jgi:hypothetical protein
LTFSFLAAAAQRRYLPRRYWNFYLLPTFSFQVWQGGGDAMLSTILIVILILLLIGALPTWPYSTGWGYYPGGGLGLILIIVIILAVAGRI